MSEEQNWAEEVLAPRILALQEENARLKKALEEKSSPSLPKPGSHPASRPEEGKAQSPVTSAEIERLNHMIADLEQQLLRYRSRWHYALFQWLLQFFKTWFVRLPLTFALWLFHLFSVLGHRFAPRKNG